MNELIYFVGPPGVGKSTTMRELTARCTRERVSRPFSYDVLTCPDEGRAIELGARREGGFSGTDALAMNVQPRVVEWLREREYPLVLGEGDRLGNAKFLSAASAAGWRVRVVALTLPFEQLDARCEERGSTQKLSWRRGRQTKVWNLVAWARAQTNVDVYEVSTARPLADVLAAINFLVPPVRRVTGVEA